MSDDSRVTLAVVTVAALALLARFVLLGDRVAHWDEARVGYWILDFWRTGTYHYRPILHGPFLHLVNARVFGILGPTDYAMRVVPALVGGLLPLVALLLSERLRDAEVVALALVLAANPVLLYYSRFMRGDVLVGAFLIAGFALLVRGIDLGDSRYLYLAVAFVALGFTVKENALVYLAAWLGAAVLLVDHRLLLARARENPWTSVLRRELAGVWNAVRPLVPALAVAVVEFLVIVAWFYAPRGDTTDAPALGEALVDPTLLPATVDEALVGTAVGMFSQWIGPRVGQDGGNPYFLYLGDLARTVGLSAGAVAILALVGFAVDRYGGDSPRDLVQFTFYWGVASLLGYPLITDIHAPWVAVHVVLPLTVPAAVGLAHVYDASTLAAGEVTENRAGATVATLALVLVAAQVGGVAVFTSYVAPQSPDNDLAQYAQPAGQMRPVLEEMESLARNRQGPHVLVYGEFYVDDASDVPRKPACVRWFNALPLPWYFATNRVNVTCAMDVAAFDRRFDDGRAPPLVIANGTIENGTAVPPPELDQRLAGYEPHIYEMRAHHDIAPAQPTVFYVRDDISPSADSGRFVGVPPV